MQHCPSLCLHHVAVAVACLREDTVVVPATVLVTVPERRRNHQHQMGQMDRAMEVYMPCRRPLVDPVIRVHPTIVPLVAPVVYYICLVAAYLLVAVCQPVVRPRVRVVLQ